MGKTMTKVAILLTLALMVGMLFVASPAVVLATAGSLTPQDVSTTAITPTFTSAVEDGLEFANNGRVLLYFKSTDDETVYITVTTAATYYGMDVADKSFSIEAGTERVLGTFPTVLYNDNDGDVLISFSDYTSMTVSALRY